jgi:hypothetical protein
MSEREMLRMVGRRDSNPFSIVTARHSSLIYRFFSMRTDGESHFSSCLVLQNLGKSRNRAGLRGAFVARKYHWAHPFPAAAARSVKGALSPVMKAMGMIRGGQILWLAKGRYRWLRLLRSSGQRTTHSSKTIFTDPILLSPTRNVSIRTDNVSTEELVWAPLPVCLLGMRDACGGGYRMEPDSYAPCPQRDPLL